MDNPDLVLQETGSRPTYSRLNYVPSGDTLRRAAVSSCILLSGAIGLLWSLLWTLFAHDSPETHKSLSPQERNYIIQGRSFNAVHTVMNIFRLIESYFNNA